MIIEGRVKRALDRRSIVLVGLMGAGKSTVGRRLAARLGLRFRDADNEIEAAAGMSIPDIFATYGEAHFRDGERRVIERLLHGKPMVLATGGGAYMDSATREAIAECGVSVWLRSGSGDIDATGAQTFQPPAFAESGSGGHHAAFDRCPVSRIRPR